MSRLRDGCISLLQRPDLRVRDRPLTMNGAALTPSLPDTVQGSKGEDGGLIWTETLSDGTSLTYDMDPATTALKRAAARVVSWLPVGWVL